MIEILQNLIPKVYESLSDVEGWDSLIVNRRKPLTYRVFRQFGEYRVCLHAFDECMKEESFAHPHPWAGAFLMLKGSYVHTIGLSKDLECGPHFHYREMITPYTTYEIVDPRTWHSVQPLERTYTIMVNGPSWENPHICVKRTKGKDLDRMNSEELKEHLNEFSYLLKTYLDR